MFVDGIPTTLFVPWPWFSWGFNSTTSFDRYMEGNDPRMLKSRHHYHMKDWKLDNRVLPYVVSVGLYGVSWIRNIKIDHALVTTLAERWRQDPPTCWRGHRNVTGCSTPNGPKNRWAGRKNGLHCHYWRATCSELLGLTPDVRSLDGASLRLR